ncbi:MAG: 2-C-methyl-D-erythritol 4-phosphate cytidylyltransferase [Eubacterium sp.]|nr:2-C-methyl-D-erythritol 4-phosphate cytidylyltransferase [Eubacterium sp.]
MNIVAILANGVGARFGSNVPKQFHKVNGKMVIEYVISSILSADIVDKLVIATNVKANSVYLADICKENNIDLIEGGDTRNRSLKRIIDYVDENYSCKKLIVCDAVRPMITGALMDLYFELLDGNDAVVTAQKITDSLGCYDFQKVDRERYYLMQSPEGFSFELLRDSFDSESALTEVTQQLPENSRIHLHFDFKNNFKLTFPADLKYLEALVIARDNRVDFSNLLKGVERLNRYLSLYYHDEAVKWENALETSVPSLLKHWQITDYSLIKTSHFGIIFIAKSVKYGKCVLKIIPPFIDRYESERSCYQSINSSFMCELYDFDDSCSAILLECCDEVETEFNPDNKDMLNFFKRVIESSVEEYPVSLSSFKDYGSILRHKALETDFDYEKEKIISYVAKANGLFNDVFSDEKHTLVHGDLHRYNIMSKNGGLCAIDPIGYIAPREFDIARYIGTELTDSEGDKRYMFDCMLDYFEPLCDRERLKAACFIDMVFRLHNSLFENEDYRLTDKWLSVLKAIK